MSYDNMMHIEPCTADEDDELRVAVDPDNLPGKVGVALFIEHGNGETWQGAVYFTPAGSRRVAAALLNGADAIEGIEPIDVLGVGYEGLPE